MGKTAHRARSIFALLHILHLVLSFGLITSLVYFYVRLDNLESRRCRCEEQSTKNILNRQSNKRNSFIKNGFGGTSTHYVVRRSSEENLTGNRSSFGDKGTEINRTKEKTGYKKIVREQIHESSRRSVNSSSINKESLQVPANDSVVRDVKNGLSNSSDTNSLSTTSIADEDRKHQTYHETKTNNGSDRVDTDKTLSSDDNNATLLTVNATRFVNNSSLSSANRTRTGTSISDKNTSCDRCYSTVKLIKDNTDLAACFEKLKVIMDKYDSGGERGYCTLFQGSKGERGEKGCAGTSFAEPSFRPRPLRLVFNERNNAFLTCTAVANPSAQITWYRDYKEINTPLDVTSSRYSIEDRDVTPPVPNRAKYCPSEIPHPEIQSTLRINQSNGSDTGTYTCMARNILGTKTYDIDLLIQVYVQLTTIPSNTTVVQGDNTLLNCRASGVPRPLITWYRKDNGPMPSHHRVAMGDLHIKNISKEEEGTFVCMAENVLGSKTAEATVTVNVLPDITSFAYHVITVNESRTLILPCTATGFPVPDIRWTKRDDTLPTNRSYFDSQLLNITNVNYSDRGEFICTANNTVGVVNKTIHVQVQVSPKLLSRPNPTEYGYRGYDAVLNFNVFADPPAEIQWMKVGRKTQMLNQSNGILTLKNVLYTDYGLYQAVARNLLGDITITTLLIVRDPVPAFIQSPFTEEKIFMKCLGKLKIDRICSALGNPEPTITWKHNDRILSSTVGGSLQLALTTVDGSKSGRYSCIAANRFGTATRHFDLIHRCVLVSGSCGHSKINEYSGRITSPNYPSNYRDGQNCYWKFTSGLNTKISLQFEAFTTEDCCDKVFVYDGGSISSPSLGVFKGSRIPWKINSTSNQLYVKFSTDSSTTKKGFSAKYQLVEP